MPSAYCTILCSTNAEDEAEKLAGDLVKERLVACVQIIPITSYYHWKGEFNRDAEFLLLMKTRSEKYEAVERYIRDHHSYEVPEIVRIPIENGLPEYLQWIDEETGSKKT